MLHDVSHEHPLVVQFRDNPYPLYHHLQATAPVQWNDVLGAWTLARYADVAHVLGDSRFSADRTGGTDPMGGPLEAKSMLVSDPPDHTRLRTLVQKAFTPRMVEQLRPRIQAIVDSLLDRALERGPEMEVIADLAYPLPVLVIAEMLGVPPEDRDTFREWSSAVAASLDPLLTESTVAHAAEAREALHAYLRGIIAQRRREPRKDLISDLVAAEERGDVLSEPELVIMCTLLLIAGHETTVNLIGNGVQALARHPSAYQQLRDRPDLLVSAVEELLRFDSPVQLTARIATQAVELGGKNIPAGDWVLPLLGAANHDAQQFADPDTLKLDRNPNPHLAFGRGIHFCLGAPLARLEGQIAIGSLVRRCSSIELAGEPARRNQITLRGLSKLPIRVRAVE
ncbi:MAG: cytochrome P450 [Chloroflexi bacterium]|nr:cytochrome P450 [Chloroflexota bacterium]